MGNCLVLHDKTIIKVIKPDGKALEYRAPVSVRQVLSAFSDHAISDSLQALQHLLPETKLLGGQLYYLVPLQFPASGSKKTARFSLPEDENKDAQETGAVRIKLVISKQEMRKMLQKGGVSIEDMVVSHLRDQQRGQQVDARNDNNRRGWKPVLESIPEILSY